MEAFLDTKQPMASKQLDTKELSLRDDSLRGEEVILKLPVKLQCRARFPIGGTVNVCISGPLQADSRNSETIQGRILEVGVNISPKSNRELLFKVLRLSTSRFETRTLFYARETSLRYSFGSSVWVATEDQWDEAIVLGSEDQPLGMEMTLAALVTDFTYTVQLKTGRVVRHVNPDQLTYRGLRSKKPEWNEVKQAISPSSGVIGPASTKHGDRNILLNKKAHGIKSDKPVAHHDALSGAAPKVILGEGYAQFHFPPQLTTKDVTTSLQGERWDCGAKVHLSKNKGYETVAIIHYTSAASLLKCQLHLEEVLLDMTPQALRGFLLFQLAERNNHRRQSQGIVKTRNPFSNDSQDGALYFLTLLKESDYPSVGFSVLPFQDWKRHLETIYSSCRVDLVDRHQGNGHQECLSRAADIRPHLVLSGPIFEDVYECRMLLESYIWSVNNHP